MTMTRPARTITSREFNQSTGAAKRAARNGPVYITNRGRPSHVLLSYEHYREMTEDQPSIVDILGEPPGVADTEFDIPKRDDLARAAVFD
ncbi:MAG: type II toxin-antitoxin system Phd/YefM family antitoxin [bacterium]|nr:type II toxin-antitoxin system Phd/YefM family antitoxin [bacterium]MDE0601666.1 type II toxin-antitoxin system Phd/YefM family antitoxin [bacterium]